VLKNLLPLLAIGLLFSACHALKPAARPAADHQSVKSSINQSPRFLDDISASPSKDKSSSFKINKEERIDFFDNEYTPPLNIAPGFNIEQGTSEQFKYAILMDVEVEQLANAGLYQFIENWWGTPYRIGGSTQRGIDCSAFVQTLLSAIYNLQVPRIAKEQRMNCKKISRNELQEGDLVFFNTKGGVSHVGVYLCNNKFVHASTSGGVMISDLDEVYWNNRFISAGRPKNEAVVSGGR
jgi:cell wall-associated NlpC family hydrolase